MKVCTGFSCHRIVADSSERSIGHSGFLKGTESCLHDYLNQSVSFQEERCIMKSDLGVHCKQKDVYSDFL